MAKLGDLCAAIGGKLVGPGATEIRGVASLEDAARGDVAPVDSDKFLAAARASKASAFVVSTKVDAGFRRPYVRVDHPLVAVNRIIELLGLTRPRPAPGIHPTAVVDPTARVHAEASIGPYCVVGPGATVGRGSALLSHVSIERGVVVGEECELAQGAVLHEGTRLGHRVKLGAHAVVGRPGFGYAAGPTGPVHIHHIGTVVLEDDVHVGAGTAIDRARYGVTRIARHAKIDNLVQIAHNCTVGERSFVSAQTGMAGSSQLGSDCLVGGQVGIGDHVRVGNRCGVGAQSGLTTHFPDGVDIFGYPAQEKRVAFREIVALHRLGRRTRVRGRGRREDRDAP